MRAERTSNWNAFYELRQVAATTIFTTHRIHDNKWFSSLLFNYALSTCCSALSHFGVFIVCVEVEEQVLHALCQCQTQRSSFILSEEKSRIKTPESNEIRTQKKKMEKKRVWKCVFATSLARVRNHIDGEDKLGSNVQQLMSTDVRDDEKRQNVVCWPPKISCLRTETTTLPMQRNFYCVRAFETFRLK